MAKPKSLPYDAAETAGPWSAELRYTDAGSDKVYKIAIEPAGELFVVNFANGKYGGTLATGTKTRQPVDYAAARKAANDVLFEKVGKGYLPIAGSRFGEGMTADAIATIAKESSGHVPQLLNAIEHRDVEGYILDPDWYMELKHDGDRRFVIVSDGDAIGGNRKGQTVALSAVMKAAASKIGRDVTLDGEQIGDVLQYWDAVSLDGRDLRDHSLHERLAILDEAAIGDGKTIVRTATARTVEEKRAMLADSVARGLEGVVLKHRHSRYVPGRPASQGYWLKLKNWNSLSAVVDATNSKRSVVVGLLDTDGRRVPMGSVTIPPNHPMPAEGDVVEVRYLYALRGGALFQPTYQGTRSDIGIEECTMGQVFYKEEPRRTEEAEHEVPSMRLHTA